MTMAQGSDPWMPNGFPPPSFVVETERVRTFAGPRGRWLAAAAILGALLLIAGVLLIARQKDDKTALKSGSTSTTAVGDTATIPGSTVLDPTATLPTATVPPGGAGAGPFDPGLTPGAGAGGATGTTVAGGGGGGGGGGGPSLPPAPGATPAALSTNVAAITIPKVDSTVGPQTGKVTLRNTGGSPVSYTSQSQLPASLTIDKPTGTLAPGASVDLTVTLDGSKVGEGPFSAQVAFDGAGSPRVTVNSVVGRPPVINETAGEPCPAETATCSKLIKLEATNVPQPTLCNTPWRYRVNVSDDFRPDSSTGQLKAVQAEVGGVAIPLKIGNATSGPGGIWQSDVQYGQAPLHGSLTFVIEAFDLFDFSRKTTPRTITCP